jgi:hypothetical protein
MISALIISILASVTTTVIVVVWLVPLLSATDLSVRLIGARTSSDAPADDAVVRTVNERLITLYRIQNRIGNRFYPASAVVARGALLSLDGWAVVPAAAYRKGEALGWVGVDAHGFEFAVTDATYDTVTHLLYVHLAGNSFPVMPLAATNELDDTTRYFAATLRGLEPTTLKTVIAPIVPTNLNQPFALVTVPSTVLAGTPIVTGSGALVGFVRADSTVIPAWQIATELGSVLGGTRIVHLGFPWEGQIVRGVVSSTAEQPIVGFYVTKSSTRASTSTIGVNDLVTAIDGHAIDPLAIYETVLTGNSRATVTILRNGKELTIMVNKVDLEQ